VTGPTRKSLSHNLTKGMIRVQLVTLALFFGLILVAVFVLPVISGVRNVHPPDPNAVRIIEEALTYEPGGPLKFNQTPELRRLAAQYPDFWFIAVASDDSDATFGKFPPEAAALRTGLKEVVSLQVMLELESGSPTLLVRTITMPGGRVKVATGGGPTLVLPAIIQSLIFSLMVATFLVLAIASGIAIPRFIRREMKGLYAAAEAAGSIDVNQRGIRIPEADLPAEVQSLVHAVNEALERLDYAHSRREAFLAHAAHELRTPIAILSARIETSEPFEGQQKLLADVTRLGELTNQLLDVQRLTLSDPVFVPVDLVELCAGVVADLAPLAIAAGYELELEAPEEPMMVDGDQGSLQRAVTNIVRNAITHAGNRGRITVTVSAPATITITDDGPGIPAGEEENIFEPFHRAKPSSEGAGLGLSLVQNIVNRHGATIAAGRSSTGGASFTITFPPSR